LAEVAPLRGLEIVRILEAAGESLRQQGASVALEAVTEVDRSNGNGAVRGNGDDNGRLVMPVDMRGMVVA
jgi:hypothetical protein